jgi:hypothetical protein
MSKAMQAYLERAKAYGIYLFDIVNEIYNLFKKLISFINVIL